MTLDGAIRAALEESMRFLRPGAVYGCSVDDHRVVIIRLESAEPGGFFVACGDCLAVIAEDINLRRVYLAIDKHAKAVAMATAELAAAREAEERARAPREGLRASLEAAQRRNPAAGEVLPPEQRASWARERTEHDK